MVWFSNHLFQRKKELGGWNEPQDNDDTLNQICYLKWIKMAKLKKKSLNSNTNKMMETKFQNRIEIISLLTFNFRSRKYTQGGPNKTESIQKCSGLPENTSFLMKCWPGIHKSIENLGKTSNAQKIWIFLCNYD